MEKDLLREMGVEDEEEDEEKEKENSEEETYKDCSENFEDLEDQISDLQLQVEENAVKESFDVSARETHTVCDDSLKNESKCSEKLSIVSCSKEQHNIENECERNKRNAIAEDKIDEEQEDESDVSSNSENKGAYINDYDDTRSIRSVSTTATIAPDVIKRRTKLTLEKRDKKSRSKRILVKGEASAVTRARRENKATIQESTGIWGWE